MRFGECKQLRLAIEAFAFHSFFQRGITNYLGEIPGGT